MSKSVVAAYNAYPLTNENKCNNEINARRLGFQQGYEQAEKEYKNQWISVDEALTPLDDGMESVSIEVVVKNKYGKATCAWYSYITNTWHLSYGEIAGDDLIDSKITHWMLIPSLKGGEE